MHVHVHVYAMCSCIYTDWYILYSYVHVCCFLQLKEKNRRIEELNGEVLSVQGQLENVASTRNVNKVDVYL